MKSCRYHTWSWALALIAVLVPAPGPGAQQASSGESNWRFSAAAGVWTPRDAVILSSGGADTRLGAAPSVSLDLQYALRSNAAFYVGGLAAFSSLEPGASLQSPIAAPSGEVTVLAVTGGFVASIPGAALGGVEPIARVGGGLKGYLFNLTGASNQWRPAADVGLGLRSRAPGPLQVQVEARYLPSSFDQAKLPVRSIVPQEQRQTDLVFSVGFTVRR